MKNAFCEQLKKAKQSGVQSGGFYYTSLMTVAIYNLFDFTAEQFDAIEAEMQRLNDEMHSDNIDEKSEKLVDCIRQIRGKDYV